jgi:2-oxoisovalerate dehydrogenase E1 component beta subunit
MPTMTLIESVRTTLRDEMARDPRVIILGEDVANKGGVFGATKALLKEFGEERVIDMPLAESNIVGTAIGAAVNGLLPVAEIQFADFIFPAMDQIVSEAARMRYRSNGDFGCPIVIRAPFGGGVHGALYHSQSVEAFFAHVPGLKVVVPSTPADTKGLLTAAIRDPDPVLFFEHKAAYRAIKGNVPDGEHVVPLGEADVKRAGGDVTIICHSKTVSVALKAAEQLSAEGIEADVVDLRTIRPLDTETILESVGRTHRCVVAEEGWPFAGVGAQVVDTIQREVFDELDAPILRVTGADVPMPYNKHLERAAKVDAGKIVAAAKQVLYLE